MASEAVGRRQANDVARLAKPAAAGSRPRTELRAPAPAAALVLRRVVVVAQAEEPHQPDDEESDVEDPKTDHPDPSLGVHGRDGSATAKAA